MAKVYLYSRVSTDQQTLVQQERTVYEWLKNHNMKVDEVVSDMGVSGGVSFADRNLGKVLLPKMQEGDVLIVSEVSRLGRSMYDLSKLIHDELKPRKLRLIVVGMGIDLNCANITPIDQLILSNFSFAAELEKHLIRERTLSALAAKKARGEALGGKCEKWIVSYNNKTKEQKKIEHMKKGKTKNERYFQNRDTQAFFKVLRNVFPDCCVSDDVTQWNWEQINTKGEARDKIINLMKDYKELDDTGVLFHKWDFTMPKEKVVILMRAYLSNIKKTVNIYKRNNECSL
jgi:DNA invertase Pin-like site-specific DNA recombinase